MLKKYVFCLLVITCMFGGSALFASEQLKLVTPVFEALSKGDSNAAVEKIFLKGSKIRGWVGEDNVAQLTSNLAASISVLGEYKDFRQLSIANIEGVYEHVVYLVRYERQPVLFKFDFYEDGDGWRIQNFLMDMDLDEILAEAAKYEISTMSIPLTRKKAKKLLEKELD